MRRAALPSAAVLAAAVLAAAGPAAAGELGAVLYERTLMREAGVRCKLFEPRLQAALEAGALQARGAALRAGAAEDALRLTQVQARAKADVTPCDSADLAIAAQRVRAAFLGWSRQAVLQLPGGRGGWTARRFPDRPGPFWALAASLRVDGRPLVLGLRRAADRKVPAAFTIETTLPAAQDAYLVRLVLRDPALAPQPYLSRDGQPPVGAQVGVMTSGRLALDGGRAWRFTFPAAAAEALARLDPRENARLDFVASGPGGERTTSVLVEVGDFAVGRAFLGAGG